MAQDKSDTLFTCHYLLFAVRAIGHQLYALLPSYQLSSFVLRHSSFVSRETHFTSDLHGFHAYRYSHTRNMDNNCSVFTGLAT
jgi:hypothetical protein